MARVSTSEGGSPISLYEHRTESAPNLFNMGNVSVESFKQARSAQEDEDDEAITPTYPPTPDRTPSPEPGQSYSRRRLAASLNDAYETESPSPEDRFTPSSLPFRRGMSEDGYMTPPRGKHASFVTRLPLSLWEYLQQEIRVTEMGDSSEQRSERVSNFFSVPMAVEKTIVFGFIICLDAFLYTFTILPLRVFTALYLFLTDSVAAAYARRKRKRMPVSHKCDLLKGVLFFLSCIFLQRSTDASRMYHSVRGQDTLKLYVIFNVLEIADRLCCSFGQDLFDSLFSKSALGYRNDGSKPHFRPTALFALCLIYIIAHTFVLFYQLVTLNVAINSYSNALLTLLLSNQFVEIKGAVFKKFEKENLFQMSCADIVERFQLSALLSIIALRNLIEVSGSTFSSLPASYITISVLPSLTTINQIFSPVFIVLVSEMAVDWLKHAFITKFNHIRPQVYGRFIDVLCSDLLASNKPVDQSPVVSKRLGFASLPLGCLAVRIVFQMIDMLSDDSHVDECAPPFKRRMGSRGWLATGGVLAEESQEKVKKWALVGLVLGVSWACLVLFKLFLGINLRAYAAQRSQGMEERAQEDDLNARNRPQIGTNDIEKTADRIMSELLNNASYDSSDKRKVKLEGNPHASGTISMANLGRFDIVKSRLY